MPTKDLSSPFGRDGVTQKLFKFGGGAETVFAASGFFDGTMTFVPYGTGYYINTGGGNDTIFGSDISILLDENGDPVPDENGDPVRTGDTLIGGDGSDTVVGGDGDDTIYGGNEDGSDASKGKNPPPTNLLIGDGGFDGDGALIDYITVLSDANVSASNDTIFGGNGATNTIYGDYNLITLLAGASVGSTSYTGGNDTVTGGSDDGTIGAANTIFGDGNTVILQANTIFTGGADTLTGGANSSNVIYGESFSVSFSSNATFTGGNDIITGGDGGAGIFGQNFLFGDSRNVSFSSAAGTDGESFTGGNDTLTGGDGLSNSLFGDVQSISNDGDFTGGDDTLIGGNNGATNTMIGDVLSGANVGNVTGGNDTLISGTNANDTMTGDFLQGFSVGLPPLPGEDPPYEVVGGDDIFVFAANNGQDTITDFELAAFDGDGILIDAHDIIDLTAFGTGLNFAALDDIWTGDTITFSAGNTLTFTGLTEANFAEEDFLFATIIA